MYLFSLTVRAKLPGLSPVSKIFYALCFTLALLVTPTGHAEEQSAALPPIAPDAKELRIVAVGDIMLGGTATPELDERGYDYPFELVRDHLRSAAVVFGNLEGPLTDNGQPVHRKQYVFRSPPNKVAPALARAGFKVVSLANNHSLDYGFDGLKQTIQALKLVGIHAVGAGKDLRAAREPVFVQTGEFTVAFLAYSLTFPEAFWATDNNPGTAFGHEHQIRADIKSAKTQADVILVSFHWGREGVTELQDYQQLLGRAAIDSGAAAVIGHHSHTLQGIEQYRGGVILYSLGNFVFGSYGTQATNSGIASLIFRDRRLTEVQLLPINVKNTEVVFQPRPLIGCDAKKTIETLQRLSLELNTTIERRGDIAVLVLAGKDR